MTEREQKNIFAYNLNRQLALNNKTQKEVAEAINVSPQTFNTWCQGIALPRMGKVQLLADYFNIEKSDLIERHNPYEKPKSKGVKIPVLGYVAAGIPITAIEDIIDYEEIPEKMSNNGEYFGLKIAGDSMEPRIKKGDVVIVKQQSDVDNGDVAIVLVNGDEGTCKKVLKYEDGLSLVSFNPAYPPKFYTWKEVETIPVVICGKVVELRGKF